MEKEIQNLDIVSLIERNPITRLNSTYNNKFVERIKKSFNNSEQQLFLGSFYCYLNYDKERDFVIELDKIWKWLGFSRIDPCKRLLEKHFTKDVDYKIINDIEKAASQLGGAGINEKAAPATSGAEIKNKKNLGGAGLNKQTILLNVKTFKKLCLKSNTKRADEIHDYFIHLEEMFQDILVDEAEELKTTQEVSDILKTKYSIVIDRNIISKIWKNEVEIPEHLKTTEQYKDMMSIDKQRTKHLTKFTQEELDYLCNYDGSLGNCCKEFNEKFKKTVTKTYVSQLKNKRLK